MKLGLGLYRHMLTPANFAVARGRPAPRTLSSTSSTISRRARRQPDRQPADRHRTRLGPAPAIPTDSGPSTSWSHFAARSTPPAWSSKRSKTSIPPTGTTCCSTGRRSASSSKTCKTIIRRVGEAGIPIIGYNFSIAGVCGRVTGPFARGGATSVGMDGPLDTPMPRGMAWNMIVDPHAPAGTVPAGDVTNSSGSGSDEFLDAVLPVAEEAGVTLAAHPDDPPMPTMRGQPRLVYQAAALPAAARPAPEPRQRARVLHRHASPR